MQRFLTAIRTSKYRPRLFHFTDTRNLPSIRQSGLLSWAELVRRGIVPEAPGGNDLSHRLDVRKGTADDVHLCLFDDHGMLANARDDGRISESVFLHIDPAVLMAEGVRFTDDNAAGNDTVVRPLTEIDEFIDHQVVYGWTDWKDADVQAIKQRMKRFEILVPVGIAPNLISNWNG